ncbi:peptidyl-prolyl cis-trans isomerase D [Geothermobacter ehrlichii]|uniref:Periplasmic chaperone PpiD n=1 Tax=Geothermobacter ehrlichii TaxID=213224 RepID=A0A5D3WMT3_9BACT|nr:SurA N-terminal domain-containing protein [Geothermobacter ehrlichii]TYO98675.1 peptidyl-prolyl cis-trans isomerase D [Geothermobacter ehrlichii]
MLDIVRTKQKSLLIKLAFAIIILSFVIGYAMLTSPKGNGRDDGPAAVVNGSEISMDDFRQAYGNLYRFYQNIYQERFTPALEKQLNLEQQAFNQLVDRALLLQEAERLDISVTKQEVVDAIAAIPAFQVNGVFNKQQYLQVLGYQRLTPDQFEAMQRQDLLVEKVRRHLRGEVQVTDAEIEDEYRRQNEKVNLAFARFAPSLFEDRVKIDQAELEAFFKERIEDFRLPEKISLRYIVFDPAAYEKDVELKQEAIEKYYRRHMDLFDIPEQVRASHVLIRVPRDADEKTRKEKRKLAEKVLEEAKAGKDFAELARTYSDDKASVAKGGDLGYFKRGTMVAPFEKAAFALQPGELSDIVESPFGYHVIKVTGYIEAGVKPLEDVLDEVKSGLRKELARQLAFEKAMDAYNINRKSGDLDAAARSNGLKIEETPLFTREQAIPGFGLQPDLAGTVFSLEAGKLARPVNLSRGVVLMALKERQESRLPELKEVREAVEKAFRKEHSVELAKAAAEKALAAARKQGRLAGAIGDKRIKIEETGDFARSFGDFVPRLGQNAELAKAAFELTPEAPVADRVFEVGGKFVIVALKAKSPADMTALDEAKKKELRQALTSRRQDEALKRKLDELRKAAVIDVSPALVQRFNLKEE